MHIHILSHIYIYIYVYIYKYIYNVCRYYHHYHYHYVDHPPVATRTYLDLPGPTWTDLDLPVHAFVFVFLVFPSRCERTAGLTHGLKTRKASSVAQGGALSSLSTRSRTGSSRRSGGGSRSLFVCLVLCFSARATRHARCFGIGLCSIGKVNGRTIVS